MIKYLLIVYLFLVVFATITWNYRPTMYANIKYNIGTPENINTLDTNGLYVSQHVSRMLILEQMILCEDVKKSKIKFNIIEQKSHIKYDFWKHLPKFTSYNLITLSRDKNSNKSNIIKDKLQKENVLLFLGPEKKNKGIYYILKETKKPLVLVNMVETKNKFKTFNTEFRLDYRIFKEYPIDKTPEEFMKWLKNQLYHYFEKIDNYQTPIKYNA